MSRLNVTSPRLSSEMDDLDPLLKVTGVEISNLVSGRYICNYEPININPRLSSQKCDLDLLSRFQLSKYELSQNVIKIQILVSGPYLAKTGAEFAKFRIYPQCHES